VNPSSSAADRLIAEVDVAGTEPDPAAGPLGTASAELHRIGDVAIGLWDAGPGTDSDVEVDEVFLVLSGAGRVTFADGTALDLRPGVLVRLRAGDRTTWQITERLRKLYVALEP